MGDTVTNSTLKKLYDSYAPTVLSDYLTPVHRPRGQQQKYQIEKTLPSLEQYARLQTIKYTTTLKGLFEEAYTQIESLSQEIRQFYDGMTENAQKSQRGVRINSAAFFAKKFLKRNLNVFQWKCVN